jgi:hypothetical protein
VNPYEELFEVARSELDERIRGGKATSADLRLAWDICRQAGVLDRGERPSDLPTDVLSRLPVLPPDEDPA